MYFFQQELEKAAEYYTKSVELAPNYSAPYNMLGYTYRQLDQYDLARKAFEKYIELIPDDPNPYDSYAELLLKMGKFDISIENYSKSIALDSTFVFSYLGLAQNYVLKGEHDKAREMLETLKRHVNNDLDRRQALFGIAITYVDQGDWDNAIDVMHKQIAIVEAANDTVNMAVDYNLTAAVLVEANRVDEALMLFTGARNLIEASSVSEERKDNARAAYVGNSALLKIRVGELDEARNLISQYRERTEASANANQTRIYHQLLGMVALEEGRWDDAISELAQANMQSPYNVFRMAQAWEGKGDPEQAQELYKEAAHFNIINSLAYAYIRTRALEKAEALI